MSGHRKGKGAKPGVGLAAQKKPWERRYLKGLTPLRSKAMPGPKRVDVRGAVVATFVAKPGLGGRRHRLRRARAAGGAL